MEVKSTEWRPGPTVCRCCLSEGCYKDISTEYFWMGKREVYAEMLSETFDVTIGFSKSGGPNSNSRLICEPCISRLRDASEFKRQVLECEKTFMQHLDPGTSTSADLDITVDTDKEVKLERVKTEKRLSDDDFDDRVGFDDDDDDDDLDDEPLTKLASKVPKKESVDLLDLLDNAKVAEKRKSTAKTKSTPAKKSKKETIQPTPSKSVKIEKKKKGEEPLIEQTFILKLRNIEELEPETDKLGVILNNVQTQRRVQRNSALALLQSSTIYPFKWFRNSFTCFYCDKSFKDIIRLREHTFSEHANVGEEKLRRHLYRLKKGELVNIAIDEPTCTLCDDEIDGFDHLRIHLTEMHNKEIDMNDDGVLPFYMLDAENTCALCGNKFSDFKHLYKHMDDHFQNFICHQCGKGFMTEERMKAHAVIHDPGVYPCEECGSIFRNLQNKKRHASIVHSGIKRCPFCSESFKDHPEKRRHIAVIHGYKVKEYKCYLCPSVFMSNEDLTVHNQTEHLNVKKFKCTECDKKFYFKNDLMEHMIVHGGETKFVCNMCGEAFAKKFTLMDHMRVHSQEKNIKCKYCDKMFARRCAMVSHAKVHRRQMQRVAEGQI